MAALRSPLTVREFVRELALARADRELIANGDDRLTYAEAEARSARIARGLVAAGAGKGTRIGVWFGNGPSWVLGFLAAARIGAITVPINTFYQTRELRWILRHSDVQHLLCPARFLSHDFLERLESTAPELLRATRPDLFLPTLPSLRAVHVFGANDRAWAGRGEALEADAGADPRIDGAFLAALEAQVTPADELAILYSSGSTADPKGAVHTHGSVLRHAAWLASQRDIRPDDRVWSPMPFFWVGGFVFALVCNMQAGATMLCEDAFEPGQTLAMLERERATVAIGWPHFGKALADHPTRVERDLSALRAGNVPDILPHVPADPELRATALGMTETCGPHTWGGDGVLPEELRASFGPAVEGVEHKIVDESGRALEPGAFGEICVRGRSLMQRLYKTEREDTLDRDGFYHTGDGGFFDDNGILFFKARLGDLIKTGGANVTPSEVEAVLAGYEGVKAAYVVGVPDPERGQRVAAAVVAEQGAALEADALRMRLKGDLSAYKVPRHVWLVHDGALPFTDSGKIDRRRLEREIAARVECKEIT